MKNKIRLILIYFLTLVLFVLIGYLIYFVINENKVNSGESYKESDTSVVDEFSVSDECTFDVMLDDYNRAAHGDNVVTFCDEYNKFNINDVNLGGNKLDISLVSYNGTGIVDENTGLFVNKNKVLENLANDNSVDFVITDDILYVRNFGLDMVDVIVFNKSGNQIYKLSDVLREKNISDNVFTDSGLSSGYLTNSNIDKSSIEIDDSGFEFSSDIKQECTSGQLYKGSTYKVSYINGVFGDPTFVNYVSC